MPILPNQMTPKNFTAVPGPFQWVHFPIFSLADVPAKPAECRTAEASIHILMSYHQSNGPVLLIGEGEEGQDSSYHLMTYCGALWVEII